MFPDLKLFVVKFRIAFVLYFGTHFLELLELLLNELKFLFVPNSMNFRDLGFVLGRCFLIISLINLMI
jgi:hypothetical protein